MENDKVDVNRSAVEYLPNVVVFYGSAAGGYIGYFKEEGYIYKITDIRSVKVRFNSRLGAILQWKGIEGYDTRNIELYKRRIHPAEIH